MFAVKQMFISGEADEMAVGRHRLPLSPVAEIACSLGAPMQGQRQGDRKAGERKLAQLHLVCIYLLRSCDNTTQPQGRFPIDVLSP